MNPKTKQAAIDAVNENHVRYMLTLDAYEKLPEAVRACITPKQVTRDTLAVAEGTWERLSALLWMSGAVRSRNITAMESEAEQYRYLSEQSKYFLADKDEVDAVRLLWWLLR